MRQSPDAADEVARIVMKFLGSARYCLGEFSDLELADMLSFLRPESDTSVIFSPKVKKGIRTVKSWPEWEKLPDDYIGVKIYKGI